MKHKIRNENSGFTLIELVITIAVLAVISVPLLMYFTDSMRHSARMKEEQNAVVAAQNVLEELKVVNLDLDTPDYLTQAVTPAPGETPFPVTSVTWTSVAASATPAATPGASADASYVVQGNYTLNNQSYLVRAKINPRKELENDTGGKITYRKAKVPGMDSSKDFVITDDATIMEDAKMFFYTQHVKNCTNPSDHASSTSAVTVAGMDRCLQRTIYLKVAPQKDAGGNKTGKVVLTARYEYQWKSGAGTPPEGITVGGASPTTYSVDKVDVAILDGTGSHNIYLFYTPIHYQPNPLNPAVTVVSDKIVLEGNLVQYSNGSNPDGSAKILTGNPGTGKNQLSYQLYLVADGDVDRSIADSSTYSATLAKDNTGNFDQYISTVYTNLKDSSELSCTNYINNSITYPGFSVNTGTFSAANHGFHYQTLVDNPTVNRMAEIEVSVYKDTGVTEPDEKNHYTTVNGTKVQNR